MNVVLYLVVQIFQFSHIAMNVNYGDVCSLPIQSQTEMHRAVSKVVLGSVVFTGITG